MPPRSAGPDTRVALLDSAEKIFSRKGYAGVGINEVLSSIGVPKGSFYHYFASKDAFGEAVITFYFEHYLLEMDQIMGDSGRTWPIA